MGKTYKHIPIAIPDIFRPLVQKVSDNLASEGSLNIEQVTFMHGTWLDVSNDLQKWSEDPAYKNIRFPLVCLLYKADEKFVDSYSPEINVDILICTDTQKTFTNDERYDINFKPILYPIYAELKAIIGKSRYFTGYNRKFEHTKIDLPHAGQESAEGNLAYNLQDVIDGVMMKGVRLKVAESKCPYIAPSICLLTPCPYGTEVKFLSIFKSVHFDNSFDGELRCTVVDYDFFDLTDVPAPFLPTMDWGDGSSPVVMGPSLSLTLGLGALQNGYYIGTLSFMGAQVQFYYSVLNGTLSHHVTDIVMNISQDLSCEIYPNNPIASNFTYTMSGGFVMTLYEFYLFGVNKRTETYDLGTNVIDQTNAYTDPQITIDSTIQHRVDVGAHDPLANIIRYKTRCKLSL
jgi:hypothetical protein